MPDTPDADTESRQRQWLDDKRQRELKRLAEWAEQRGHPDVAAQLRESAKTRRPLPASPPKPGSPAPEAIGAYLQRRQTLWDAFYACVGRKHPGHTNETCPHAPYDPRLDAVDDPTSAAMDEPGAAG
jgi:hypothetical protein